jgi:hypothetical protein
MTSDKHDPSRGHKMLWPDVKWSTIVPTTQPPTTMTNYKTFETLRPTMDAIGFDRRQQPRRGGMNAAPPASPPLWRVMHDSWFEVPSMGPDGCHGFAAELRLIAEAIRAEFEGACLADIGTVKMIRDFLSEEADRAEAGD